MGRHAWRRLSQEVVEAKGFAPTPVFDPCTGQTHFLTELPALILAELDITPCPVEELIQRLAGPDKLDQAAEQRIQAALTQLEAAELVESRALTND